MAIDKALHCKRRARRNNAGQADSLLFSLLHSREELRKEFLKEAAAERSG